MSDQPSSAWWRVELNSTGKILSVRQVEAVEANTKTVVYVQATHEIDARTLGRQAYNTYQRNLLNERRSRMKQEGRCRCGARLTEGDGFLTCARCRGLSRVYESRANDKKAGKPVAPLDRRETHAARRRSEEEELRLEILGEVRDQWRNHPTVGGFTRWLEGEIAKLTGIRKAG